MVGEEVVVEGSDCRWQEELQGGQEMMSHLRFQCRYLNLAQEKTPQSCMWGAEVEAV